jgi:hypothetical protein
MGRQELFQYPPELDHEEWAGYERGPIDVTIASIMNVIYQCEFSQPPLNDAARIAELAKHVLADRTLFLEWERQVVERLLRVSPRRSDDPEGEPIPRQLMDISSPYDERARETLIDVNFTGRDFSDNPFFTGGTERSSSGA